MCWSLILRSAHDSSHGAPAGAKNRTEEPGQLKQQDPGDCGQPSQHYAAELSKGCLVYHTLLRAEAPRDTYELRHRRVEMVKAGNTRVGPFPEH